MVRVRHMKRKDDLGQLPVLLLLSLVLLTVEGVSLHLRNPADVTVFLRGCAASRSGADALRLDGACDRATNAEYLRWSTTREGLASVTLRRAAGHRGEPVLDVSLDGADRDGADAGAVDG